MTGHGRIAGRTALLAALLIAIGAPASAHAATITVNDLGDAADTTPADGICDVGGGKCTLRAAIQTANQNNDGQDTILVPAGTINRTTGTMPEDASVDGDLDIAHDPSTLAGQPDVVIKGAGIGSTIIDAHQHDRVLQVLTGATASISGLTMRGGQPFSTSSDGAGVRADGNLTLDRVEVTDNHTSSGACGGVSESLNRPTVVITNSLITHNSSAFGGGVCELDGGSVSVADSTISNNVSASSRTFSVGGGGVESGSGTMTFTRTLIENNTSNEGGGLAADGGSVPGIAVVDSTVRNNHAVVSGGANSRSNGSGGGISEDGTDGISVLRSTISGNTAERNGGGFFGAGGAGGGGSGGRPLTFDNSTIDGNSAQGGGGGLFLAGFQFDKTHPAFPEDATLNNVTLNGNRIDVKEASFAAPAAGGAQISACGGPDPGSNCVGGSATITNSIVSGATPQNCSFPEGKGSAHSGGHNIDSGVSCGFGADGDKSSINPQLGPLQDNGGPTATDALLAGSPAIDAAGSCPPPATDQRGIARPQGQACDIGAYELIVPIGAAAIPPPPRPGVASQPTIPRTACADRREFKFHVHHARSTRVVDIKLFINGRLAKHLKGKNLKSVTIGRLPQSTFNVRIEARQSRGGELVSRRTYRGCDKSAPKTRRARSNRRRHR